MNSFRKITLLIGCLLTARCFSPSSKPPKCWARCATLPAAQSPRRASRSPTWTRAFKPRPPPTKTATTISSTSRWAATRSPSSTPGFRSSPTTDVTVNVGARQRVDVAMQVGAITESVEVTGAAAALETDSSEHGQVINYGGGCRTSAQRPQLRGPGAAVHQRRQVAHRGLLLAQRHAARRRLQRERHAQHV